MTAAVVAAAVGWAVAVGLLLFRAASHIGAGERAVRAAQTGLDASTIALPHGPDLLAPVVADFGAAHGDLTNPLLAPVRVLPVVGRQLRTVQALATAARTVGRIGEDAVGQARAALQAPHTTGPERVAAVSALAAAAAGADRRLSGVTLGPDRALVGFVRSRYDEFATRLRKLRTGLHRGAVAAAASEALLRGPSRVLLLAANNAEMRDGSGMFLSLAEIDIDDGTITVSDVQPASDLTLPPDAVAPTDAYATVWSAFVANADFRNLGLTPRFDTTAALAARMWQARTGRAVGAVMSMDIAGLRGLLSAIGPVSAGSATVTATTVVGYLMHDQYVGLNNTNVSAQARHEQLGLIARATLGALEGGGFSAGRLATALPALVGGRHLMLWSSDPSVEQDWVTVGAGGTVRADALLLAVQNMGANKLDTFLTVRSDIAVQPGRRTTTVTVTAHLANAVPPGQPAYVAGNGAGGEPPSTYRAYVTLSMPVSATDISVDGAITANAGGVDGPIRTVAVLRDVAPGQHLDVAFTFVLPVAHGHLQVESAARVPPSTIVLDRSGTGPIPDERRPRIQW